MLRKHPCATLPVTASFILDFGRDVFDSFGNGLGGRIARIPGNERGAGPALLCVAVST